MKQILLTTIAALVLVGCATLVKDTGSTEEEAKKVLRALLEREVFCELV